jgi:hypothetical protein
VQRLWRKHGFYNPRVRVRTQELIRLDASRRKAERGKITEKSFFLMSASNTHVIKNVKTVKEQVKNM